MRLDISLTGWPLPLLLPALLASALLSTGLSSGCAPMVVAGAAYGGAVLHERRSAQTVLEDQAIELQASQLYFQNPDIRNHSSLSVTCYNYEALLTGQAESAVIARRFAELIARLPKVTKVYNEVEIGPNISVTRASQDAYLGSRAKLALADIKLPDFDPMRVKVVAENGVIYLMGLVTAAEADATVDKVRRIPGVVRVVRIFNLIHVNPQAS
ncbi:BON domain-containing protein [Rhabdochromatium marinum]|uniref:BON domain-containing protein n=1 Tax=Rhabdochromatium marinum TaxID=48729 RepID=UPI001908BB0C|nr:BON domain-containing protein [Rhabdochromatium marinum]MBK1647408.1 transporter [Rhabdochromatium marinum]